MPAPYVVPALAASNGVGPTRAELRHAVADQLGDFFLGTASATPSSVVHPDADRQLLVTALGVDGQPPDSFDGAYLYIADGDEAGESRKILSGTFDGADSSLLLDRPFSSPLASGTAVEVTRPLPGSRHLMTAGLNQCIDEALARIWVRVRIAFTGNDEAEYDLAAYPWLRQAEQVRGVYDATYSPGGTTEGRSPYGGRLVANGAGRSWVTNVGYSSDDAYSLDALGPADRLVYDGTDWGYATEPGLLTDAYRAACPVHWVVPFALVKALQHLTTATIRDRRIDPDEKKLLLADYEMRRRRWATTAAGIKLHEFAEPAAERTPGMLRGTGESSGVWEAGGRPW